MERKHFVLVHGSCHGAWSWFKLKPKLESAGHQVTALDLAASGRSTENIKDVNTMAEYSKPLLVLLASLPPGEKVILVGHSHGGICIAQAMDKFPEKVAVGVFLAAFMPDTEHKQSYVLEKYRERTPPEAWLDTQFLPSGSKTSMFFGPQFLSDKLYQLCSIEDLELAKTLVRPSSLFTEALSKAKNLSKEGYGAVPHVFITCKEDKAIPFEFQQWMIQNGRVDEIVEIKDADHMSMLCKPQEIIDALLKIASNCTK